MCWNDYCEFENKTKNRKKEITATKMAAAAMSGAVAYESRRRPRWQLRIEKTVDGFIRYCVQGGAIHHRMAF